MKTRSHDKVLAAIAAEPWAITQEGLEQIITIANRENDIEALRSMDAQKLNNTRNVEIRDNGVAVIPITGPIFRYSNLFTEISGATSIQVLAKDIQKAVDDSSVKAIVFEVDSPGGQVTGVADLAQMIHNIKKPTRAYVGGAAASAAYWLASAADEMISSKTGVVGSIGVLLSVKKDAEDEIRIVSSQSPHKVPDPKTDSGRTQIQATLDELADVFISAVADYRGVDKDTVLEKFGQGGVKVAGSALKAGMIDSIGLLETLIAGMSGQFNDEVNVMSENDKTLTPEMITADFLKANYPAVANELIAEGAQSVSKDDLIAQGRNEGAEAECQRIKGVFAISLPGHEALVNKLAFDGKTSPDAAAAEVLKAEKEARGNKLSAIETAGDLGVTSAPAGEQQLKGDEDKTLEEKWAADADLRAEFNDEFEAYKSYEEANAQGLVKIYKK